MPCRSATRADRPKVNPDPSPLLENPSVPEDPHCRHSCSQHRLCVPELPVVERPTLSGDSIESRGWTNDKTKQVLAGVRQRAGRLLDKN